MTNQQCLSYPVARTLFLASFHLSQGDSLLQEYLLKYAATCRPSYYLSAEDGQRLQCQLSSTIQALITQHLHCPVIPHLIEQELKRMLEVMSAAFQRPHNQEELVISIFRGLIFRDWRYLCDLHGRPRSGDLTLPHHDPYLSYCCYYLLLNHHSGVKEFDKLLTILREAIVSHNAVYEAAMDYPSVSLCLSEVIVVHNTKHPECQVADPIACGKEAQKVEVYGEN